MEVFYFTFGVGQRLAYRVQPIEAESYDLAREAMFEMYGDKWAFQYDSKAWAEIERKRKEAGEQPILKLPVVYA